MSESNSEDSQNTSRWSAEMLQEKRAHTDPLADQVVATIISSGYEKKINEVFHTLIKNETFTEETFKDFPDEVRTPVTDYFNTTKILPDWVDNSLVKKGEEVFSLYGPEISMLLNVKSLPLCYACSKGAKVLHLTGRLSDRNGNIDPLARRLMETAQMIINAMAPGGLQAEGKGIVTMQKVRLIHASIRYFIKHPELNKAGWDVAEFGEPINQEDMAGTLMSFASLILKGLEQLNINLSLEQQNAYMHCWRIVGHVMGVDEDLIPKDYAEGWELGIKIMKNQAAESSWGKELTTSCIHFLQSIVPGNLFDRVPEYMIWYFSQDVSAAIGKDIAPMIGVHESDGLKGSIVLRLMKVVFKDIDTVEDHSVIVRKLTGFFNRKLLQGFLHHYNDDKNVNFYIPPSLQQDWKLKESWEDKAVLLPPILGNRITWQKRTDTL
ncbi:MAG: oxygenase MpaB family protein [Bacteroidota bacterium]